MWAQVTDGLVCIYANYLLVYLQYAVPVSGRLHTNFC